MQKNTAISHVVVYVSDIKKAREFYDKLMSFLGLPLIEAGDWHVGYGNDKTGFWLRNGEKAVKGKREVVGYDHVAFRAESRNEVDALQKLLEKEKFKILYSAEEHPEFVPGYYSVSFLDPDGTILEFVYIPGHGN